MTRAEWLALAERVEKATGPDRELDAEIARAIGWQDVHGSAVDSSYVGGRPPGSRGWLYVPSFTCNLDAAAALVPEGWAWSLYGGTRDEGHATAYCIPRGGAMPWAEWVEDINAATPALALTAAACRAQAEEAGE